MFRMGLTKGVLWALAAAAVVSIPAATAEAGWGHYYGRAGVCCPSYVSVYRPVYVVPTYSYSYAYGCCDPCADCGWGYYGGVYGWHGCRGHRHAYWAPGYATYYRAPAYYYGFYGYSGVTGGCCNGGPSLSTESPVPAEAAPQVTVEPASPPAKSKDSVLRGPRVPPPPKAGGDADAAPALPADAPPDIVPPAKKGAAGKVLDERSTRVPAGGTILTVHVPADAKVYINGNVTTTIGTQRRYVSLGLEPGRRYTYEVRAVRERNGQELADTKSVQVGAGETAEMSFGFEAETPTAAAETSLTLYVPEDANVILAGNPTDARGAVRHYATRGLAPGQTWSDYRIVVTVIRDGRPQTEVKTIRVTGGQSQTLSFHPAESRVAAR
jgi:uncharacterized protein (TIGR03000 family)